MPGGATTDRVRLNIAPLSEPAGLNHVAAASRPVTKY